MPSGVWDYFKKIPHENAVTCNICGKRLTHNSSSTGIMLNHLRLKHPTEKAKLDDAKAGSSTFSQPSISSVFSQMNRKCSEKRSEKITELILDFLVSNMLPFKLVESKSFETLISYLEPNYRMPSRVSFSNNVRKKYEDKKNILKDELLKVRSISVTTDSWMSLNSQSFTTVTGHFINDEWKLKSVVLNTLLEKEHHTADNLRATFDSVLEEYGIENKVEHCVHDNASNVVQAMEHSAYVKESLNCVAHSLQLCINKALNDREIVKNTIGAASRLVSHFKHSYKATSALSQKQEQLGASAHKLIQRCATRWNSTAEMFERLQELRWAVCAILSDRNITKLSDARTLELKDSYWKFIEDLTPVLQPLKVATTQVSNELSVSLSSVVPILCALATNHLNESPEDSDTVKRFKQSVIEEIKKRFNIFNIEANNPEDQEELSTYVVASFFDPRHKHFPFYSESQKNAIYEKVSPLIRTVTLQEQQAPCMDDRTESSEDVNAKRQKLDKNEHDMAFLLGPTYKKKVSEECEINNYLYSPTPNLSTGEDNKDILVWWKANESNYPRLAKLARRYLATLATSVPSERIFSSAGRLLTKQHSRLSVKKTDMILFLHQNMKTL